MAILEMPSGPLVSDIPGQLRKMANDIESGEVAAYSVILIIPVEHDWPRIFGWGEHPGDYGNIAILELAKTWFVTNLTGRN